MHIHRQCDGVKKCSHKENCTSLFRLVEMEMPLRGMKLFSLINIFKIIQRPLTVRALFLSQTKEKQQQQVGISLTLKTPFVQKGKERYSFMQLRQLQVRSCYFGEKLAFWRCAENSIWRSVYTGPEWGVDRRRQWRQIGQCEVERRDSSHLCAKTDVFDRSDLHQNVTHSFTVIVIRPL